MNALCVPEKNEILTDVENYDALLKELKRLWIDHRKVDLEVRFQVGKLINERIGIPGKRLTRYLGVIARIADELDLDKTEISQYRRFAARYSTFDQFSKDSPKLTCWTKVRKTLTEKDPSRSADGNVGWALLKSFRTSVKVLNSKPKLTPEKREEIRSEALVLAELLFAQFGIRYENGEPTN